ncbi:MAG: hypothetical protein ACD_28C00007G0001, partial [uncultured bacterium]
GLLVFFFDDPLLARKTRSKSSSSQSKSRKKKEKVEEKTPEVDEAYYDQIWSLFELGSKKERKDAMGELKKRLKKEPTDGLAHFYLGLMQSEDGPANQAEEHLRSALTAFPDSAEIYFKLGDVVSERKSRQAEARTFFEKAVELDPTHGNALSNLGLMELEAGKNEEAAELLKRAKAADPENLQTILGLGKALYNLHQFQDAIPVLKAALAFDEKNPDPIFLLGKSFEGLGRNAEAAECLEKAKALGHKEMKELIGLALARALADTGKYQEAVGEYKKAVKVASEAAVGWFELAELYQDYGEDEKAVEAYQKTFELDKEKTEAMFRVGMIRKNKEEYEKAIKELEKIAKKKDEWGEQAKEEIELMKEILEELEKERLAEIAATGSNEDREKALLEILAHDKKNLFALEGLRDYYQETGDFGRTKGFILELKKAGHIDKDEADRQVNDLQHRFYSGDDLAALENGMENARQHGDWDEAIKYCKRLQEEAKYQLTQLQTKNKTRGEIYDKARMIKLTRLRIKKLAQEMKDLRREKNKWK